MIAALLAKFRPLGPWRSGPDSGEADRVDPIHHSDSFYSAVTNAMASLGLLEEWLAATALQEAGAAVRFTSCYPFQGSTLYVVPPKTVWPPEASTRVRWKGARFVPTTVVDALLAGEPMDEEKWAVDGPSECLVRPGQPGPFREGLRGGAAVDRLGSGVLPHLTACVEFGEGAGLWTAAMFRSEDDRQRWSAPVRNALRLLADTGIGGKRSRGWGRFESPVFSEGTLESFLVPGMVVPQAPADTEPSAPSAQAQTFWLLSLYVPSPGDPVLWNRGNYSLTIRSGRVDSPSGAGVVKKDQAMVSEGSVIVATGDLAGAAPDVAPDGFPHPVFRSGSPVAIPIYPQGAA